MIDGLCSVLLTYLTINVSLIMKLHLALTQIKCNLYIFKRNTEVKNLKATSRIQQVELAKLF